MFVPLDNLNDLCCELTKGGGAINDFYTCEVRDGGMRMHESLSPTIYDCTDQR